MPWEANPLYALLHESIYCQGAASNWAAHRVREAEFDAEFDAVALANSGEETSRLEFLLSCSCMFRAARCVLPVHHAMALACRSCRPLVHLLSFYTHVHTRTLLQQPIQARPSPSRARWCSPGCLTTLAASSPTRRRRTSSRQRQTGRRSTTQRCGARGTVNKLFMKSHCLRNVHTVSHCLGFCKLFALFHIFCQALLQWGGRRRPACALRPRGVLLNLLPCL